MFDVSASLRQILTIVTEIAVTQPNVLSVFSEHCLVGTAAPHSPLVSVGLAHEYYCLSIDRACHL